MRKSIVFISPNSLNMMGSICIKYAKDLGYDTAVVVDYQYNSKVHTDYIIYTNMSDVDTLISDLAIFNLKDEIAGIVTYSDFYVEVTALANDYFGLIGPSFTSVLKCKNKLLCRMELNSNGWKQPKSKMVKNDKDFKRAVDEIGFPCVIKPMNGVGSAFTLIISDDKNAYQQFLNLEKAKAKSSFGEDVGISNNWVIEECLDGFQISVESFTHKGETTVVCIHDKLNPILPPLFRVFYSATPSPRIDKVLEDKIIDQTKKALNIIGFDNGVSHTEFRISNTGNIQLLEVNARTGGGLIIPSAFYSTKVNLYTVAIDIALGRKPQVNINHLKDQYPVVFKVIYPDTSGMLCNFLGLEEQTKNFEIIEKIANVGDIVSEGQRLGLILKKGARGQSIDEIVNYIDDFVLGLDVIIKPIKRDMPLPSHIRVR